MPRTARPEVQAVIVGYQDATSLIRERVLSYVRTVWDGLGAWRDTDINDFVAAVVPVVRGGQIQVAAMTDAYLAAIEEATFGDSIPAVGVPDKVTADVRGLPATDVYQRPGQTVWWKLSLGLALGDAVAQGGKRAESLAATDLQLAKTKSAQYILGQKDHVVGYRRVVESSNPCGLCLTAVEDRYHSADLMPIHPSCDCSVEPIYGSEDPGRVPDGQSAAETDAALADRFGDGASAVVVHQHGEIGPTLAVKGQSFLSDDDF
jgi:hypothetical protein